MNRSAPNFTASNAIVLGRAALRRSLIKTIPKAAIGATIHDHPSVKSVHRTATNAVTTAMAVNTQKLTGL